MSLQAGGSEQQSIDMRAAAVPTYSAPRAADSAAPRGTAPSLLQDIAAAANDARRLDDLFEHVLQRLCEEYGWSAGHVFLRNQDNPNELSLLNVSYEDEPRRFDGLRKTPRLRVGQGLPGRVVESGSPQFARRLQEVRPDGAWKPDGRCKLALCFPIASEGTVNAAMEFVSDRDEEPDDATLELMASAGDQLGLVIDRIRTAQQLYDSEERFRLAVEAIGDYAIYMLDTSGRVATWNEGARRIIGYTREQILGRHYSCFHTPEDIKAGKPERLLRQAAEHGRVEEEGWRVRRNGERYLSNIVLTALRHEDGTLRGYVKVTRDVTQRRQTEEHLRRSERLASIGTLAAGIAHEINNPLAAILLEAQFAVRSDDVDALRASLKDIAEDVKRCARIVQSVLKFTRDETTDKWPNNLNELVERSASLTRVYAQKRQVTVSVELADEQPDLPLNPMEVELALVNLIRNAIEACKPGGTVRILTEVMPQAVRLIVKDDGHGMDEQQRQRALDPFYTTRQSRGGTGLGLSLSHGIVTDHGGALRIESQPGQGTAVIMEFPRTDADSGGPRNVDSSSAG